MEKRSNVTDFTEGNVAGKLVRFATPLFLSSLLQIVYNTVDMVIVGNKMGKVGLSAVSVGGDVLNFLTFVAMGFSNAGQVIIARMMGEGERKKIGRFIGTMFHFLTVLSLAAGSVCFALREPILRIMHTPSESFGEALGYATVCMAGLVFIYGYNAMSAVLRGMGDSLRPFVFIGIASVVNVVLDLLFVMGLGMGGAGAALGTVISQGISFLGCAVYVIKKRDRYGLDLRAREFVRPDGGMLCDLVKLGVPMAIKNASISFSKLFVNSWINSYGVAVSAFAGVANKLGSIANLISNSFNAAGATMVGQNIGARKYGRIKRIVLSVYGVTVTVAAVLSAAILIFPRQIYGFFTSDGDVIDIGIRFLPIAVLLFFGSAARSGMNALINGSGNYKVNFATAILDGIVLRIGLALLFGLAFNMRETGFWLGDALAGYTPLWIGIVFYLGGWWKRGKE